MKKIWIVLMMLLVLTGILSGCFRSSNVDNEPQATPGASTAPSASAMPNASAAPEGSTGINGGTGTNGANNGSNANANSASDQTTNATAYDWVGGAGAVEGRIGMFSEIGECRIVTSDTTALVGVRFADAYQGALTKRIRDMIAGEVMAADTAIQVVAVTAEPGDVATINQLADQQKTGTNNDAIKSEVDRIARNTTTLR